jgi:hypothetical protein
VFCKVDLEGAGDGRESASSITNRDPELEAILLMVLMVLIIEHNFRVVAATLHFVRLIS